MDSSDSQATVDEEMEDAPGELAAVSGSAGAPPSTAAAEDEATQQTEDEATQSEEEAETESDEDIKAAPQVAARAGKAAPQQKVGSQFQPAQPFALLDMDAASKAWADSMCLYVRTCCRSRASSPEPALFGDARLTARQRARMQKEAGLAEDVQWHEMTLPSELAYNWKGDKRYKSAHLLSEEEWLKRQEALERRRMRSIRDKREAEESVKAKIRKAVTAKFRGKLLADASGTEGEGAAAEAGAEQEAPVTRPGWVKVVHSAAGVRVAWSARAHPVSLPAAVSAGPCPGDPIDLLLQSSSTAWHVPAASQASFRLGCSLSLQPAAVQAAQQQLEAGQLWFVDEHGWHVGCLQQQQVLEALAAAGYRQALEPLQQQQQQQQQPELANSQVWQQWRGVVKSIRGRDGCLQGVTVRVLPAELAEKSRGACVA